MLYFVSRQSYVFVDEPLVVEIARGGLDYANADMLSDKRGPYKSLGCGQEYTDPREAIQAAFAIREAWIRCLSPEADCKPRIEVGYTGGNTLPFEEYPDDEWLKAWAEQEWEQVPKCAHCGEPLPDNKREWWHPGFDDIYEERFCSENCVEQWSEWLRQDPWGGEEPEEEKQ